MGIAALIVSGGVLLSRVLGVVREIIFADLLGADAVTDQYVAAFRIPDFMNYLLAGGFLSITFIPIFSRYLAEDDEGGPGSLFPYGRKGQLLGDGGHRSLRTLQRDLLRSRP